MKTTKPISTISYNSPQYLELILNDLVKAKILTCWHFIEHEPEDDEAGNKKHIHLYVVPAKLLQTDDLTDKFLEFDVNNPTKPKKCIAWRNSKRFGDWYLYAIHDPAYLASKGQSRRYRYKPESMKTSDEDELTFSVREIDLTDTSPYQAIIDAQRQGLTFSDFFARGTIPIQQIRNWQTAWELTLSAYTNRNGRAGHDDPEPEVVELDGKTYVCNPEDGTLTEAPKNALKGNESPAWYDVHPQGEYVQLDPENGLPL